ncbi:MAG: AAA family ATPase [bacterium]
MYLSSLRLWNFRKFGSNNDPINLEFPDLIVNFNPGLNALIGENDSGKSCIIDAIKIILDTHSSEWNKISDSDFHKNTSRLRIECRFDDFIVDEAKYFTEWLSMEGEGDKAKPFLRIMYDVTKNNDRVFPASVKAGMDEEGYTLNFAARELLKCTYLKPLRDAKNELMPRKGSRLSQILMGLEPFKNNKEKHYLINDVFNKFDVGINEYFTNKSIDNGNGKAIKVGLEKYLTNFFGDDKKPKFSINNKSLREILEILKLTLEDENLGLGSQNLLFMATEILNLNQVGRTCLNLGLIEELEAHLHPQAQLKIIQYLQNLAANSKIQLIITTHSPNIGSKLNLENLIICNGGKVFPMNVNSTKLEPKDYIFLEKFLDVTKSNLFFAKGVIFVEGWSEELLIPVLARGIGLDLTKKGVSIINVGGTAFLRYAKIFVRKDDKYPMDIPVAIITDKDKEITDVKATKYNYPPVKAFISPERTLEICLLKSSILGGQFKEIVNQVHKGTDGVEDFNAFVEDKLEKKTFNKTEVAYNLSHQLESYLQNEDKQKEINSQNSCDDTIYYLLEAIRYATGN